MRIAGLFIFLFIGFAASAQHDTSTFYFHRNLNPCPKEYATYIAYGVRDNDGLLRVNMYLMSNSQLIMTGTYTDTTLDVKQGYFQYFRPDGKKESAGYYKNNLEHGSWVHYQLINDDRVMDSTFYENGSDITSINFNYHANGKVSSRILSNSRDKIKEMNTWDENGAPVLKAVWIDNTGDRFEYYPDGKTRSVENYKNGKSTGIKYYNPDGSVISKKEMEKQFEKSLAEFRKKMEDLTPAFPGGRDGFRSFLDTHFRIPDHLSDYVKNLQLITIVFSLNEKGLPVDISILETTDADLLNAVTRFFKDIPRWDMKGYKRFGPLRYQINIR